MPQRYTRSVTLHLACKTCTNTAAISMEWLISIKDLLPILMVALAQFGRQHKGLTISTCY